MPALMDSAVLLGGDVATPVLAAKALHPLEASGQLDTAAPTPTASGALDDWQVVTLAEIQTALAGTLKDVTDSPRTTGSDDAPHGALLSVSPGKARKERSRLGRPKSGDRSSQPAMPTDGADGDAEAAPKGPAKVPAGGPLPGRKPAGICAWNPFAGLGPKLMGPRQKAGAHILDLAALPNAAAAGADTTKPTLPPSVATIVASIEGRRPDDVAVDKEVVQGGDGSAKVAAPAALADSTPDIDAAAADAGVANSAKVAGSDDAAALAPDYDTARECGGSAGKGAAAGRSKLGKGIKAQDAAAGEPATTPPVDGDAMAVNSTPSAEGAENGAVPAAASNYSLPKGKAKKGKKKRAKK